MMRRMPTNISTAGTMRIPGVLRGLGLAGIMLALFIAFEVGIRNAPPDGMIVTYEEANSPTDIYTSPRDQGIINDYYWLLNTAPMESPFVHINGCSPIEYPQFVFTWHGIPVESWSGGCIYTENSGGISGIFLLRSHLWEPAQVPLPAPAAP